MKVSDLTISQLNHWVAKALGWEQKLWGSTLVWFDPSHKSRFQWYVSKWQPAEDWAQGGPIIEREKIGYHPMSKDECLAAKDTKNGMSIGCGQTTLIAAMRCFVAAKFGDEVPDEMGVST